MKYKVGDIVYATKESTTYDFDTKVLVLKIVYIGEVLIGEHYYECEILNADKQGGMFVDRPYAFLEDEIDDYHYFVKEFKSDDDKELLVLSVDKVLDTKQCIETAKEIEEHLDNKYRVLVIDKGADFTII